MEYLNFYMIEYIDRNIKEIILVARDGYTIEKIFSLFNKNIKIKTHYICSTHSEYIN